MRTRWKCKQTNVLTLIHLRTISCRNSLACGQSSAKRAIYPASQFQQRQQSDFDSKIFKTSFSKIGFAFFSQEASKLQRAHQCASGHIVWWATNYWRPTSSILTVPSSALKCSNSINYSLLVWMQRKNGTCKHKHNIFHIPSDGSGASFRRIAEIQMKWKKSPRFCENM